MLQSIFAKMTLCCCPAPGQAAYTASWQPAVLQTCALLECSPYVTTAAAVTVTVDTVIVDNVKRHPEKDSRTDADVTAGSSDLQVLCDLSLRILYELTVTVVLWWCCMHHVKKMRQQAGSATVDPISLRETCRTVMD